MEATLQSQIVSLFQKYEEHVKNWNDAIFTITAQLWEVDKKTKELRESLERVKSLPKGSDVSQDVIDSIENELSDSINEGRRWSNFYRACAQIADVLDKALTELQDVIGAVQSGKTVSFQNFDYYVQWILRNLAKVKYAMRSYVVMPVEEVGSAVSNLESAKLILERKMGA